MKFNPLKKDNHMKIDPLAFWENKLETAGPRSAVLVIPF